MNHNVFISYPNTHNDLAQNLKKHLESFGVKAWTYVVDRTLSSDIWNEIKYELSKSDLVLFIVSDESSQAEGQQRELVLSKKDKILPLFISGTDPKYAPERLNKINGEFLNTHNVKEVALKIAKHHFPSLVEKQSTLPWHFPIPGNWLEVINLNNQIEQYFDLGDKLYFRTISPIGLFECYAPKIEDRFWIARENVKPSYDDKNNEILERRIPHIYTVAGMTQINQLGWMAWQTSQDGNDKKL